VDYNTVAVKNLLFSGEKRSKNALVPAGTPRPPGIGSAVQLTLLALLMGGRASHQPALRFPLRGFWC